MPWARITFSGARIASAGDLAAQLTNLFGNTDSVSAWTENEVATLRTLAGVFKRKWMAVVDSTDPAIQQLVNRLQPHHRGAKQMSSKFWSMQDLNNKYDRRQHITMVPPDASMQLSFTPYAAEYTLEGADDVYTTDPSGTRRVRRRNRRRGDGDLPDEHPHLPPWHDDQDPNHGGNGQGLAC